MAENSAGKTYAPSILVTERQRKSPKAIQTTRHRFRNPVLEKVQENLPNFVTDNSRSGVRGKKAPVLIVYPQVLR